MEILLSLVTAFFIGFLITPIVIFFSKRNNITVAPGGRKIHYGFIPSMGGIAIMLATFVSILIWMNQYELIGTRYIIASLILIFFVGLRDDLVELSAVQKIVGQVVAGFFIVIMSDIRISSLYGFLGVGELPLYVSYFLSFIVLLALTNSFNLIDGVDGLAATLSIITLLFLGLWFYNVGHMGYSLIIFTLVGAILSFLVFNWHPAKIFMGDTGSLCIGFSLAVLIILFIEENGKLSASLPWKFNAPISTGIALMIIPIYDTIRIMTKRIINGKSPLAPDKSHVHHFLLRMGFQHNEVVYLLGALKIAFILLAIGMQGFSEYQVLPVVLILAIFLGTFMDYHAIRLIKKHSKSFSEDFTTPEKSTVKRKPKIASKILKNVRLTKN